MIDQLLTQFLFVRFFYTKSVEEIDLSEMHNTYMAANKYLALSLIQEITDYLIRKSTDVLNVCVIFDQILKLTIGDSLISDVKGRIAAMFREACTSDSFKQISQDTLITILNFNMLNIAEVELLKACLRWTDKEVVKQNLEANQANKRKIFQPIKHLIRFGDLSLTEFSSILEIENYLTLEEIASIFLHLNSPHKPIQIYYRAPRGPHKAHVARTRTRTKDALYCQAAVSALDFYIQANQRVLISLIKTLSTDCRSLKIKIFKGDEMLVSKRAVRAHQPDDQESNDDDYEQWAVDLNLELEPNTEYILQFTFTSDFVNLNSLGSRYHRTYAQTSNEMTLKSDDSEAVFTIKSDLGCHCIESIDFWPY